MQNILSMALVTLSFVVWSPEGRSEMKIDDFVTLAGTPAPYVSKKPKQMVMFWASWCKDCKSKLKNELVELNTRPDVEVITINLDSTSERAQDFVNKQKVVLPVYRHPTKTLQKALKVFSVPHWAVYVDGVLQDQSGGFDLAKIELALKSRGKS